MEVTFRKETFQKACGTHSSPTFLELRGLLGPNQKGLGSDAVTSIRRERGQYKEIDKSNRQERPFEKKQAVER